MKLDDFLKCKKVRLLTDGYTNLNKGSEYNLVRLEVVISNNAGIEGRYPLDDFEPVLDSAENPLQNIELTPEFEAVEPTFKVGDKVYYGNENRILTIAEFDDDGWIRPDRWVGFINNKQCCHATPENYALLSQLYPHIEFEQQPKPLTGSDLARAMLDKGWKYVPCYVSNTSDKNAVELDDCGVIYAVNHNGNFQDGYGETWCHAVPFDLRTGEPLTESVLDE